MATIEEQNEIAVKAMQFKNKVNSIIEDEEERGKLFDALRNYLETKKVKRLVRELKLVLDNSKKYPLFKEIRAFIESEHLFAFDKLTEGARTGERIVHLKRHGTEPLGFKFKGGLEHNIGIYVTSIVPGSAAHFSGLRVGDEILKVNGFVLHESIHDEVVNVLKSKKSLTFVTKNMGKIPNKVNNRIVWQEVDPNMNIAVSDIWNPNFTNHAPGSPKDSTVRGTDDKLVALKVGKDGLGCSIRSGIENFTGVFISAVTPNQLAEQVGLRVGDQILQVNGKLFDNIQHSEAVNVLKSRKDLTMIIRHNEGVADYLLKRAKNKSEALKPILILEDEQREIQKHASFGDEPVVEYIEPIVLTEEEEQMLENELNHDDDDDALQVGDGNYQFDEEITQGKEVHLVSILKTAPLMLDLEMKNDLIVVRSATKGGAAADNGFLKRGDVLLNVEGVDLVGLSAAEAQEAISEATSRLSHHIDLIVACAPGRKPPERQDIDKFFEEFSSSRSNLSELSSDLGQGQKEEGGMKSLVTKFIAQFESQSRRTSAFLLRRDSLERARNSLRLYKGNKKRPPLPKATPVTQDQTVHSASKELPMDALPPLSMPNSQDAGFSPQVPKKSMFALYDPTPINIASTTAAKQSWQSAVRKISENGENGTQSTNSSRKSSNSEPPLASIKSERISVDSSQAHEKITSHSSQASQPNKGGHSSSSNNGTSVDGVRKTLDSQKYADSRANETNATARKHFSKDEFPAANGRTHARSDDVPLSPNQHIVQALVHSPPQSVSSDDMISTWAPTSPLRGHSASTENLMSRKSVVFNKHISEVDKGGSALPAKFRSRSVDELNERVERFPVSNGNAKDRRGHQSRKKSVGFKETVERIEPSAFKSMDDISMIGRHGWEERMSRHDVKRQDQTKQVEPLPVPKKSALRNSPSPVKNDTANGDSYDEAYHRHMPPGSLGPSPDQYKVSREDAVRSSAIKPSSSKAGKLQPSNSLEDDPSFNEEIDRLGRSVDKSFVIPEPDYEGAIGYTASQPPPPKLTASKQLSPPEKKSAAKQQPAKEKKKDAHFGVTNKLLNSAKDKLKRVGLKRSSQTSANKDKRDSIDKQSEPSKPSPPTAKLSLVKPPAPPPPPPPPPPQMLIQASSHSSIMPQPAPRMSMQHSSPLQQLRSIPRPPPVEQLSDRPAVTSHSPPPVDSSLSNMILNSPVRRAAATRDFRELEERGFKQAWQEEDSDDINRSMDAAMASAVMEDVKLASVVAGNDSGPRSKAFKGNKLIDMTDVLSELKMKNNRRKQRPITIHSEMPSTYDRSYSNDFGKRVQTESSTKRENVDVFGYGRSSIENSPSRSGHDPRESRISRRQARSVADIDSDSFDLSLPGIASNQVTPRSARSLTSLDAKERALLEMEGTLKEFDEVIQSLDTEL